MNTTTLTPARPPGLARRFVRSLGPSRLIANLRNPIFQKEVYVSGRRRTTYVVRSVFVLILLAIIVLAYVPMFFERGGSTGVEFLQALQEFAPLITVFILWFQFAALVLVAPMLTGSAICDERRSGSLGALLTTPLTAFQIAGGKLSAALVQVMILALLAVPPMLALRVFGGVPAASIGKFVAVNLSLALLLATLALYLSARSARGITASAGALLFTFALQFVPFITPLLLSKGTSWAAGWSWSGVRFCAPIALAAITVDVTEGGMVGAPFDPTYLWRDNVIYNLSISAIFMLALVVRLRRVMIKDGGAPVALARPKRKKPKAKAASTVPLAAGASSDVRQDFETRSLVLAEHDTRDVGDHPVLWRELRQPAFRSRTQLVIACIVVVALLVFLNLQMDDVRDRHGLHMVITAIGSAIFLLLGCAASSGAFSQERESRTFDVLLTTPLTAREIIRGKYWGAMRRQWFIPAMLLVHVLLSGVLFSWVPLVALVHLALLQFSAASCFCSVGVWMSVRARRTMNASIKTGLICLGMWLLPFPVLGMIGNAIEAATMGQSRITESVLGFVAGFNPVFMSVISLGKAQMGGIEYDMPRRPWGGDLNVVEFSGLVIVACLFMLGIASLARHRAAVVLARIAVRSR